MGIGALRRGWPRVLREPEELNLSGGILVMRHAKSDMLERGCEVKNI